MPKYRVCIHPGKPVQVEAATPEAAEQEYRKIAGILATVHAAEVSLVGPRPPEEQQPATGGKEQQPAVVAAGAAKGGGKQK